MRILTRPRTLWCLFAMLLIVATAGLTLLSRHTLDLDRQRLWIEQRRAHEQNVRIALWRIDSRLAPLIATVHDFSGDSDLSSTEPFVRLRFRFGRDPRVKGGDLGYWPVPFDWESPDPNLAHVAKAIPLESLVAATDELFESPARTEAPSSPASSSPASSSPASSSPTSSSSTSSSPAPPQRSHVKQTYAAANIPNPKPPSRVELSSRAQVVQQQVEMNQMQTRDGLELDVAKRGGEISLMSLWIEDELVLVRRADSVTNDIDGVWLDWPVLKRSLLTEIADIVPQADIRAAGEHDRVDPEHRLASIPAAIWTRPPAVNQPAWSATATSLVLAWCALLVASTIAAFALHQLISLSERRAAFVSAVTHELRTPLTTFRLYSELLERGMVNAPEDRDAYLKTLRIESERLSHLVDNVLRFSKLQQTSSNAAFEPIDLSAWIERIRPRLVERLAQAGLKLVIDKESTGLWHTDPAAMEQVVFNLVDNAAKYAVNSQDRRVHVRFRYDERHVGIDVQDAGPGVAVALRKSMFQPFTKSAEQAAETAAGIGLGLALVRQTVRCLGGTIDYRETPGGGATFQVKVPHQA